MKRLNKDRYSVVVHPGNEIINEVKEIKNSLSHSIGWYSSRNAEVHITLAEFDADPNEFILRLLRVKNFCYAQKTRNVKFDNLVISDLNNMVFLLPNSESKIYMKGFVSKFRKMFGFDHVTYGSSAHISIGKHLQTAQILLAKQAIGEVSLNFNCEKIAVRKFDPFANQFTVIYEFYFLGEQPLEGQLSLFE